MSLDLSGLHHVLHVCSVLAKMFLRIYHRMNIAMNFIFIQFLTCLLVLKCSICVTMFILVDKKRLIIYYASEREKVSTLYHHHFIWDSESSITYCRVDLFAVQLDQRLHSIKGKNDHKAVDNLSGIFSFYNRSSERVLLFLSNARSSMNFIY